MRKRILYATLEEVPEAIREAYRSGTYNFQPPPGPCFNWDTLAWINYVSFQPALEELRLREVAS